MLNVQDSGKENIILYPPAYQFQIILNDQSMRLIVGVNIKSLQVHVRVLHYSGDKTSLILSQTQLNKRDYLNLRLKHGDQNAERYLA